MEHEGPKHAARLEDVLGEVPLLTKEEVDAFMASIVAMVSPEVECAPVQSAPLDERTADDLIELIAAGVDITPPPDARAKLRLGLEARKNAGAEPLELVAPAEPAAPVAPVESAPHAERKDRAKKAPKAPKAPEKTAPTKAAKAAKRK